MKELAKGNLRRAVWRVKSASAYKIVLQLRCQSAMRTVSIPAAQTQDILARIQTFEVPPPQLNVYQCEEGLPGEHLMDLRADSQQTKSWAGSARKKF
ncbi:hypothetical protein Y1Q_0010317 [Alligator mississippiensis]|uniref:Uncharacterized protein n=1 Tax=Alligator mississippiensis TaxID=8496 RepID=A0A151NM29_ALLMI|nr:hypothetical protein Y1Q_0010317 [Alligator mississippiensis]